MKAPCRLLCWTLFALFSAAGCFSERSHALRDGDFVALCGGARQTARPWLRQAHDRLKSLLPSQAPAALLTEDMTDSAGRTVDVFAHFKLNPRKLDQIFSNQSGLSYTAQLAGPNDQDKGDMIDWTGFEFVSIPISNELSLSGQLGWVRHGDTIIDSDCIVILPGLLGHNDIRRTKDLADGLRAGGFHVLACELRGHGRTNQHYPNMYYTFGVLETGDLLAVSQWLQNQPHVRRTGLVGFCWGANEAMLTAWHDGRGTDHPSINERLRQFVLPPDGRRHFEAGVIAFSPVLRFEDIVVATNEPMLNWQHPVLASLQATIRERMIRKNHVNPCGDLRKLIDAEFSRSVLSYPGAVEDGLDSLRFLPFRGRDDYNKLDSVRIPVLIVQAANDPLAPAQDVADLCARIKNQNVAAIVLPDGGHVGFAAYARSYYFSLIFNFFKAGTGPIAADRPGSGR